MEILRKYMSNSSTEKRRDSSVGSDYKIINEERINSKKGGKMSHGQGIIDKVSRYSQEIFNKSPGKSNPEFQPC